MKAGQQKINRQRFYPVEEAVELLSGLPKVGFKESFDVAIRLGVNSQQTDQTVRGSVELPHGLGRKIRVAVFADGAQADAAREAGAEIVGLDDLAEQIKAGKIDFEVALATPAAMKVVSKIGAVLGPRGLMPSPRDGTVAQDMAAAVKSVKTGQVRFKTDRYGLVHASIGRLGFEPSALRENLEVLLDALKKAKPPTAKGTYFRLISLSTTMGPGIRLDMSRQES